MAKGTKGRTTALSALAALRLGAGGAIAIAAEDEKPVADVTKDPPEPREPR
jgi:ABC-type sugar transport system substrate-binding protein